MSDTQMFVCFILMVGTVLSTFLLLYKFGSKEEDEFRIFSVKAREQTASARKRAMDKFIQDIHSKIESLSKVGHEGVEDDLAWDIIIFNQKEIKEIRDHFHSFGYGVKVKGANITVSWGKND